jgi:hypothetical protein
VSTEKRVTAGGCEMGFYFVICGVEMGRRIWYISQKEI